MVFCRCVIEPNSKVKLCLLYQAFSSFFLQQQQMPKTEEELMPPPEAIPNVQHHRRALPKLNKPSAAITDGKSKYFYFLSAPWFLCKTHLPPFYSIQICTRVWNWLNGAAWKTSVARKSNSKCQIFSNEERYVVLALLINVHCRVKIIGLHQNVFVTGGGKTFLRIFTNKTPLFFVIWNRFLLFTE